MAATNLILIETLCVHYEVEVSFIESLSELGLIEVQQEEQARYLSEETITDLEKMIRLHQDLEINPEGIDVIFHLLKKVDRLNQELTKTKTLLRRLGLPD